MQGWAMTADADVQCHKKVETGLPEGIQQPEVAVAQGWLALSDVARGAGYGGPCTRVRRGKSMGSLRVHRDRPGKLTSRT